MTGTTEQPRIVVGVDGSAAGKEALRWAVAQARMTGARVEAIGAWEYPTGYGWEPVVDAQVFIKTATQNLTETVDEVAGQTPDVPVRSEVVEGHPARVLIQAAQGAALLVVGSRGHGGFVGALLGSVSQYCVQHAPCPVVVIRGPHT